MIEKLKTINQYDETEIDMDVNSVAGLVYENTPLVQKINELVDAVNELQLSIKPILEERESGITVYEEAQDMYDNAILDALKDKQVDVVEEPADSYAEQRKWIGKLCKFRDKDYKDNQWDYGLLQAVANAETAHIWKAGYFKHNLGHWYEYCEPIKPDDDIIYKGE